MWKRTLLAMTALSSLVLTSPALHDTAMAGQFNKPSIRPSIRIISPRVKTRINTRRFVTKAAKKPARNRVAEAGPHPERPARPKTAEVARAATPPLPRQQNPSIRLMVADGEHGRVLWRL